MVRENSISVYLSNREKNIIRKNAKLHGYKGTSTFLRDCGLNTDISNKGLLAIVLTYLSIHLQNYSPDKALKWTVNKAKDDFKMSAMTKFAGMPKDKYEATLIKLEETITYATELKEELSELLKKRKVTLDAHVD
jgi:hypothetical protein